MNSTAASFERGNVGVGHPIFETAGFGAPKCQNDDLIVAHDKGLGSALLKKVEVCKLPSVYDAGNGKLIQVGNAGGLGKSDGIDGAIGDRIRFKEEPGNSGGAEKWRCVGACIRYKGSYSYIRSISGLNRIPRWVIFGSSIL